MSATLSVVNRVVQEFGCMCATLPEAGRVGRGGCMSTSLSEADRVGLKFGCMSATLSESDRVGLGFG